MVGAYIEFSLGLTSESDIETMGNVNSLVLNIRDTDLFKAGYVAGVLILILALTTTSGKTTLLT